MDTVLIIDDPDKAECDQNVIELKMYLTLDEMQRYYRERLALLGGRPYSTGEEEIFIFTRYVHAMRGPWLDTLENNPMLLPYKKRFVQRAIDRAQALHRDDPEDPEQPGPK